MENKGRWELGLGRGGILGRVIREHLADDRTSTQKPEEVREWAMQIWI